MEEHPSQALGGVEFTHRWYRDFLREVRGRGYECKPFSDAIGEGDVVLRHDVDLSLEAALEMARIEAEMDVRATYFVLLASPLYNPQEREERARIGEIESLGHDVAVHFSTHEYWPANEPPAEDAIEARVREERDVLGTLTSGRPETVSFHIPPEWVLDRSFPGFRSAYAPAYFSEIPYLADSGQRWRDEPPDLPDPPGTVQVLTHPGLWGVRDVTFEERIERAISAACSHANRQARREFIHGVTG